MYIRKEVYQVTTHNYKEISSESLSSSSIPILNWGGGGGGGNK